MSGLLLEGKHGVGKSFLLHKMIAVSNLRYGGYYVQRIQNADSSTAGFCVCPIQNGQPVCLTVPYTPLLEDRLFFRCEPQGTRYYSERFLQPATTALQQAMKQQPQVMVLDELGGGEVQSQLFLQLLQNILEQYPIVGTFKAEANVAIMQRQSGLQEKSMSVGRHHMQQLLFNHGIQVLKMESGNVLEIEQQLRRFLEKVGIQNGECF